MLSVEDLLLSASGFVGVISFSMRLSKICSYCSCSVLLSGRAAPYTAAEAVAGSMVVIPMGRGEEMLIAINVLCV